MSTLSAPDSTRSPASDPACDPASRVTRSLLGYGIIAGPFYVVVSLAQALTRDGFDLTRHEWSLLANGPHGWIQTANLVLSGLMVLAAAAGLQRTDLGRATSAPQLIAGYGIGLVAAGLLTADPALGFPIGTPDGPGEVSWHGLGHLVAAGIGFLCLIAACLIIGRWFSTQPGQPGRTAMARFSRIAGVVLLAGFASIAATGGGTIPVLAFTGAIILVWTWLSVISAVQYRRV